MGDCHLPHLLEGQGDRRQSRVNLVGDELLVVDPDDGHVLTHPEPLLADGVVGAHGHAVIAAHQPGHPRMIRQQAGRRGVPAPGGAVADGDVHGAPGDAGLLQVGLAAGTSAGRRLPVIRIELDDADVPMVALQEGLGGQTAHLLLIGTHAGQAGDRVDAVDQDGGDLTGLCRHADPAVPSGGVDDALDPGLQERLEGLGIHVRLGGGRHDEQGVAGAPDRVLDATDRGGAEGAGDDLRDQPDERGTARGQGTCTAVGAVTELSGHLLDAVARLRGDAGAVAVVEDEGHGGARDAGSPGHVLHGGPVGVAHPDSSRSLRLRRPRPAVPAGPADSGTRAELRLGGSLPGRRRNA